MTQSFLARLGLVTLVVSLGAAGLWFAGGPSTARLEQRNFERKADLDALGYFVECVADSSAGVLPETLATVDGCWSSNEKNDPYTGTAYRYSVLDKTDYWLCADFEDAAWMNQYYFGPYYVDVETGCIRRTYQYRPSS